ncbi:MAG: HRDC domain-containing protein [Planctomycetaceae bacterium]
MSESLIVERDEFEELCAHIKSQRLVAFDTEFVSEYTYRPELCLLQFATKEKLVAVDPYAVRDLASWWKLMADEETRVIVHGGQAEVRFCLDAIDEPPRNVIDLQIAEGFRGRSYPLAYKTIVPRVLGRQVHSRETRTDWRRRPLSPEQTRYAIEDVDHVLAVWDRQERDLTRRGRVDWVRDECRRMIEDIDRERNREPWERLSGVHKLSPRELAVLRELAAWREAEAERRDRSPRRILRDDLLMEMVHRQPRSENDVAQTRDMNRKDYKRVAAELVACVERGLALPPEQLPRVPRPEFSSSRRDDEQVIGKLLSIALANRCAEVEIAQQLVGTSADLQHLVRWHVYKEHRGPTPRLLRGWRAEVCGDLLTDVLDGKITLRVAHVESDHPLAFERRDPLP